MTSKYSNYLLPAILLGSLFLLTYRLPELFPFIGDQGWFYLSARNMVISGEIPLVGITTSHTWLHHGALFTYLLAFAFWIFTFHPVSGVAVTIPITLAGIILLYKLGKEMFGKSVGIIAALLFATSPLVLIHTRMAYHTSPLAFCSILFIFSTLRWVRGDNKYLSVATFSLALLYNFEISAFVFFVIFGLVVGYGFIKKQNYILRLHRTEIISAMILFIIPMIPMLIYDISHGFPQTLKFGVWLIYKIIKSIFLGGAAFNFVEMMNFVAANYQKLIFISNGFIAFIIFIFSFFWVGKRLLYSVRTVAGLLISLWIVVPLFGEMINHTTTEAHLLVLYAPVILVTSLFISSTLRYSKLIASTLLVIIVVSNISFMINNDYLMGQKGGYGPTLTTRIDSAKMIVADADGKKYNLIGQGPGSEFDSFTMNYEYLTWWIGYAPSQNKEKFVFKIRETEKNVTVEKSIYD